MAVVLVYLGLIGLGVGLPSLVKPLRFVGVRTRMTALKMAGVGMVFFLAGAAWPAPLQRAAARESRMDDWMPAWQFREFHSLRVKATPQAAYLAIREVTASEIFLFRTLTWIRNPRLPGSQPEHILNPPADKPILEVAQAGGFRLLADEPPHEIVLATLVVWDGVTQPTQENAWHLLTTRPGNAPATINFRVRDDGGGWCTVITETRVFATDSVARRRFAVYWRVIYPGSSLLRYTWLRAIRARAEGNPGTTESTGVDAISSSDLFFG